MRFWHRRPAAPAVPRVSSAVFAIDENDVGVIDIERGPCIDADGSFVPCDSLGASSYQIWGDPQERLEVLFSILDDEGCEAPWASRQTVGAGSLLRFSEPYARRLAALGLRYPPHPERAKVYRNLAEAWLAAATWPSGQTAWAVENRLTGYAGAAVVAAQRGLGLYCWVGPERPATLADGTGRHPAGRRPSR